MLYPLSYGGEALRFRNGHPTLCRTFRIGQEAVAFFDRRAAPDRVSFASASAAFACYRRSRAMLVPSGFWRALMQAAVDFLELEIRFLVPVGARAAIGKGVLQPAPRQAERPDYARESSLLEAFDAILDECLAQIMRNAIGIVAGDPRPRAEHVHQLRIGIRRLRSAVRCFRGWLPEPPAALIDGLRVLFATLGRSRDRDVLANDIALSLARAGGPSSASAATGGDDGDGDGDEAGAGAGAGTGRAAGIKGRRSEGPDPVETIRAQDTQRLLRAWLAWRAGLAGLSLKEPDSASFRRRVDRRLRRWHRRIATESRAFDTLDEIGLHGLRKRVKRQRYAVEFFAPLLRRKSLEPYLDPLQAVQDRMGAVNDLIVAREHYQEFGARDPAAWFALGWLAARIAQERGLVRSALALFAKAEPPRRRKPGRRKPVSGPGDR